MFGVTFTHPQQENLSIDNSCIEPKENSKGKAIYQLLQKVTGNLKTGISSTSLEKFKNTFSVFKVMNIGLLLFGMANGLKENSSETRNTHPQSDLADRKDICLIIPRPFASTLETCPMPQYSPPRHSLDVLERKIFDDISTLIQDELHRKPSIPIERDAVSNLITPWPFVFTHETRPMPQYSPSMHSWDVVERKISDDIWTQDEMNRKASIPIEKEALSSLYDKAHSLIQKELRLAEGEGKKLLIIVGERHDSHNSLISELIFGLAAHQLGINDILTETDSHSIIDELLAKPVNLKKLVIEPYEILMPILMKMGGRFYSVDPLRGLGISEVRNQAINTKIASLDSNSHSIFFCGSLHLVHLINDDLLQARYRLLPINTVSDLNQVLSSAMSRWIDSHSSPFFNHFEKDWGKIFKVIGQLPVIQQNNKLISTFQKLELRAESFVSFNPQIDMIDPPSNLIDVEFPDFIQNFDQSKPFQRQLVNVMHQFYIDCLKDEYQGLIVYGDPGTGKTHCCTNLVDKLKDQGKRIISADFHHTLLSDHEFIQLLTKHLNGEDDMKMTNEIIAMFEDQWKNADLFFVDDANKHVSALTYLTRAIITYAERNKKKILINANTHPFETVKTLRDSWNFDGQLRILEVRGEDYRQHRAWHKNIKSEAIDLPSDKPWTSEQKEVFDWIQKLKREEGPCGLFITGSPGIGKTTAIREALKNEKTFWLSSGSLKKDALIELSESDAEFLILEDVNEIRFDFDIQNVLSELLNNESLVNKDKKEIKIIITSNESSFVDRLKHVIDFFQLSDRMRSRFFKKFKELHLRSKIDFRTPDPMRGIIMDLNDDHHALIRPGVKKTYEFSLKDFCSTLTMLSSQKQYSEQVVYRNNVKKQAIEADCIVIKWESGPNFRFQDIELPLFLDLMENQGRQLIFKTENPSTFLSTLEELFKNNDPWERRDVKSLSRIKRLVNTRSV